MSKRPAGGEPAPQKVRRRAAIQQLAASVVAGTAALAAQPEAEAQGQAPPADAVTPAEIAAAARLSGRTYSDAEREQMARRVTRTRTSLKALQAAKLPETLEPATEFDPRLPGAPVPAGSTRFTLSTGVKTVSSGDPEKLAFATTVQLARLIRARKITSTELTRLYLDRLKRFGPRLLCVVTLTEDLAMEQAARADREIAEGKYRGPLHGIPWGAKDLLSTRGIRTTWGAKPYESQVFDYDATVVQRLEAAGAVLVAKLTLGELAQGDVWFGGMTRNPWKLEQGSSGSSAGPGSATAAGLVGFSIGSETLGSIVSPSVRNGVTGLRPTYGRVPRTGAMSLCWTMDKLGPMCRGVEDCAAVLHAIYGPDEKDGTVADVPFGWNPRAPLSQLKVGIDQAAFDNVKKDAKRAPVYAAVLDTLRGLGIELRPVKLPAMTPEYNALSGVMIGVESAASFAKLVESGQAALLAQQGDNSWPNTFRVGSTIPAVDYLTALRVRRRLQQEMAAALGDLDLYVTVPFEGPTLTHTNLTGHPALVTRCGIVEGVPQSIEFTGNLYREEALLRVGFAYEQATPWHEQWPTLA